MPTKSTKILALLLSLMMLLGAFASCAGGGESETSSPAGTTTPTEPSATETTASETEPTASETEPTASETEPTASETEPTATGSETAPAVSESETAPAASESETDPAESETQKPDNASPTVENANYLANGVQAYFTDASRKNYCLSNTEMTLNYARNSSGDQLVSSLSNKQGASYVENTMDVFIRMKDGATFYASQSTNSAEVNLYRFGYYYYQGLFEFQNFIPKNVDVVKEEKIEVRAQLKDVIDLKQTYDSETEELTLTITDATDPRAFFGKRMSFPTEEYDSLIITAKTVGSISSLTVFIDLGNGYKAELAITSELYSDGEYHTYCIPLYNVPNYSGNLSGIRLDPNGSVGSSITINGMSIAKAGDVQAPNTVHINRHFHVYSDKMHHAVQFAVTERTENIAEVGMITELAEDKVASIMIVTEDGKTYTALDSITDWKTVVAVGFDVKDAGIFGFILPNDDVGGSIKVELKDGVYVIEQTRVPVLSDGTEGVIIPSIDTEKKDENGKYIHAENVKNNGNDFYLGQRIYTDSNHDFSEFLKETGFERDPLDEKRISISSTNVDGVSFKGYDPIRGIYVITIGSFGNFSSALKEPNRHYKANFTIRSDFDRDVYFMCNTSGGSLECATLMDENLMLLPVPIEVIKNFSEPLGERNLFNISDPTFSEAIFPLSLAANTKHEYTLINLYQNWGKYPLKQLSQIPFHCPYYHLSTGTTETNCIVPWFTTDGFNKNISSTLPDFRGMSAPYWFSQPQHNSCGSHAWLYYTDTEGNSHAVECKENIITSYGPTYAEVAWENLSDDGKIKVTYTHMEMPQLDENRTYYTMEYEFLEDLTIDNFKDNFQFYNVTDNNGKGTYKKVGYLNEQNEYAVVDSNQSESETPEYVLGDECPYFSFFMMPDWDRESTSAEGYSNVAFLVYNSEFIVNGEKADFDFLIKNPKDHVLITLNVADSLTFKAGDSITINAILLPWGSQELEDDPANRLNKSHTENYTEYTYSTPLEDGTLYMDKNVRDVRENTLLNPLTVTSETDEIIESPFLPKVRSADGKSATFTLSGGQNNVAVRIYGFDKLTTPKVEELIDGEWVDYELSSKDTPDAKGYYHYYDGYSVNYDADYTYSYSFVTTMTDGAERTFRINAFEEPESWPEEKPPLENENYLDGYTDHEEIFELVSDTSSMFGTPTLGSDDTCDSYASVYVKLDNDSYKESYATFYKPTYAEYVSGQYLVIKYRVPASNTESLGAMQIWTSTERTAAGGSEFFYHYPIADGDWHVDVIDLSTYDSLNFQKKDNGYCAQFVRIDVFNKVFNDPDTHIDIAYIGIDSDLSEICKLESGKFDFIELYENGNSKKINTATGEEYIDSTFVQGSQYSESEAAFGAQIDSINGTANSQQSGSKVGAYTFTNTVSANADGQILLKGWCAIEGGISKYVWTADGGATWHDCLGQPNMSYDDIVNVGAGRAGVEFSDKEATKKGGSFQGEGLTIDLSDYAESEEALKIYFCAVPENDQESVVILYTFNAVDPTPAK